MNKKKTFVILIMATGIILFLFSMVYVGLMKTKVGSNTVNTIIGSSVTAQSVDNGLDNVSATNGSSHTFRFGLSNGTYLYTSIDDILGGSSNPDWSNITNIPQLCYANGTGCSTSTDSFVANYSTFLTHATTSYVNSQNSSMNNYLASNNDSVKNYILYVNGTNGAGSGSYNDAWINQTFYNKSDVTVNISSANSSMNNYLASNNVSINNYILYVNSTNGAGSGSDSFVANYSTFLTLVSANTLNNGSYLNVAETDPVWSSDKPSYFLTSNFNVTNTTYGNWNKTYADTLYYSISNPSSFITASALSPYLQLVNWNSTNSSYALKSEVYNKSDVTANITSANTTMQNYVDTRGFITSSSLSPYALKTDYYNKSDVTANITTDNNSQTNYINTKLALSGGTMTGNITLGTNCIIGANSNISICSNTTGFVFRTA